MPKASKKSTLLRQWQMLRTLMVSRSDTHANGKWDSATDIAKRLCAAGYPVSNRTVQRDLLELKTEVFPEIELNDKNPRDYGWRWKKGAHLAIPGMGVSEALTLRMVEMHMKHMLPASMLDGLQGLFCVAQAKLDQAHFANNHAQDWLNKVRVVPPAQPLLAPVVDAESQAAIYQGLLEGKQLSACYQPASSEQPKDYVLHPLGLIMRGTITYLVASAGDYTDARLYALHRFSTVEVLKAAAKAPKGFDLDAAIGNGLADFANQGEPIKLELRCTDWVAAYLAETPLAADQSLAPETDGWVRLTATVNDTWQLRWWILGQGDGITVCSPLLLKKSIQESVSASTALYLGLENLVHKQKGSLQ